MTIQDIANRIEYISLNHKQINGFYIGNTWDMSASKSSDIYPCVWLELPVLVSYTLKNQKTLTFSFDVLALPKPDDVEDELKTISECERIADQLLQAFQAYIANTNTNTIDGLSVKNINADIACGVRVDMRIITNRECDYLDNFKEVMIKQ